VQADMRATPLLFLPILMILSACAQDTADPGAARGKQVYLAECIMCHHSDPSKDGSLGPAVKGSSRELLEAKVLRATYPPGYTPKRTTSLMPAMPQHAPKIPDLAAYLR
jgi:mono/diheme cytochrome c family protein